MAQQLSLDLKKTAVIIMDYQMRQLNAFPEKFQKEIMARANKVLDKARQKGIYVINVEVVRGERTSETAIHPAMVPKPGDLVLTKRRVGPFSTTNLDESLKQHKIDTLVMMGIRTMGCVISAVRWAADIDYKVIVLSDCCADQDEEVHRVLIGKVMPFNATVMTSSDFLQLVDRA